MYKKTYAFLIIVAVIAILPAVNGPLLLDDTVHIDPIIEWLHARSNAFDLIFGNTSGPFGRPISILSFMLNAVTTGALVWPMKLTNLIIHLITGICLLKLFFRLFKRDENFLEYAKPASLAAAAIWLILPQHIATVFYVIQRMTELVTLFAVLACWLYVVARERMERNEKYYVFFLLGSVVFTVLAVLSKESGLLIPLYLLLIELIYFHPIVDQPRPKFVAWGFRLAVIYPSLIAAAYLALNPGYVLDGYIDREFTMPERVLTQISVLADYFASTFFPMMRSAGVFNDDFPISHSLSLSDIAILLGGIGLVAAAIKCRKTMPSFSFGIGWFFTGHILESSVFSLEIYFVHRNYLPSIGLVIATFGLIIGLLRLYPEHNASLKRTLPSIFIAFFLAYGAASFSRANLWSNNDSLMTHAQINHPTSSRMRSEILLAALYRQQLDVALHQAELSMQTATPNEKRTVQLWRILAYCYAQASQPETELEALSTMPADRITLATSTALDYVSAAAEANACPGLDRKGLGTLVNEWATNTVQPPDSTKVWKAHFAAARLLAASGDLAGGLRQARWAFEDSGFNFDIGILAFQLANSLDDAKAANEVLSELQAQKVNYTNVQQKNLTALRKL